MTIQNPVKLTAFGGTFFAALPILSIVTYFYAVKLSKVPLCGADLSKTRVYCYPKLAFLGIFQEKYAKFVNRDIFFEIFLVKRRLCRTIEGIDKMDKVKGAQKALRLMSGGS